MNKAIVVALLLACAFAKFSMLQQSDIEYKFNEFSKIYNKKYASPEQRLLRLSIFKSNLQNIDILSSQDSSAKYGITQFADLTQEEFSQYLGFKPSLTASNAKMTITSAVKTAPDSYNWVNQGAVTPVKNQGQCGSCWAFSTTGAMEGQYQIKTKDLTSFSEQQLVDCDTAEDQGCNGGLMDNAFKYLETAKLETEKAYPYTGVGGKCAYNVTEGVVSTRGFVDVSKDESVILQTLFSVGPLSVAINANPLQFYTKGIFDPLLCNPKAVNHGVLLVGYGSENNKDFWTVKNSWGTSWGEQGYFRIVRGEGKCGINTFVSYPDIVV